MMSLNRLICSIAFITLVIFTISSSVDAAYKKLPLNGSMFGKRGTSIGEIVQKLSYFKVMKLSNFRL